MSSYQFASSQRVISIIRPAECQQPSNMIPAGNTAQLDPSNATTKVFNTFELLENILIHVSTANLPHKRDDYISRAQKLRLLYPLQRVNRTFCNVINRSKTLRKHMLKDIDDDDGMWDGIWDLNPFAFDMEQLVPVRCASFLLIKGPESYTMYLSGRVAAPDDSTTLEEAKQLPRSASWRQMLIWRDSIDIVVQIEVEVGGVTIRDNTFHLGDGATLGQLADIVVSIVDM